MSAVDRAVRLISLAYGYGQHFDGVLDAYTAQRQHWTPANRRTGEGDENNPAVTFGLSITKGTETLLQAGAALNPKDKRQAQLMSRCDVDALQAAQRWSDTHSLRKPGRGFPYKVREFKHWQSAATVVIVPRCRPTRRVLEALADAALDGPLEHVLMFAATQQQRYWPKVRLHAMACGHPAWAVDEAGLLLALGRWSSRRNANAAHNATPSRRQRDRALALGMRAEDYASAVRRAGARLDEWLDRSARRVLESMAPESNVIQNYGEASAKMTDTWWHPKRPANAAIVTQRLRNAYSSGAGC